MTGFDGHEIAVVTTMGGALALLHRSLPRGWVRGFIHRQPIAAMASFWALAGITMPLIIPPLRRTLRLPTNQYDAEHPRAVTPKY
jgi:hypothetical protein